MLVIKTHRKRQWFHFVLLLSLLIAAVMGVLFLISCCTRPKTTTVPATAKVKADPQPATISSNVLFLGNTFWGRYINDWSKASTLGYAYPFSRLNEFNRDQYDAWISGVECPITAGVDPTSAEQEAALQFNCRPEYLPEVAKWFTAFTLANNHTDNQNESVGFAETQRQLESAGIQYFGHYDPRAVDDICEIIGLPVTVTNDNGAIVKGRLPVAMCGYHGVFRIPSDEAVLEMKKYSEYMPVIAMPHMGAEYQSSPDEIKTDFYHSLIDNGADMVLGDHPHWVQNTESYNGHLIVYSMGNFIFDQQYSDEVTRSAGIRVVMKTTDTDSELLKKWLILGEKCVVFKDDCLEAAQQQGLTKLSITYKFGVISTNDADRIVKPATIEQTSSVLERLNWQSTVDQLQAPYSSL